jgi:hypothetical protein
MTPQAPSLFLQSRLALSTSRCWQALAGLLPVHDSAFDLGLHRWQEPFDRIARWQQAAAWP